MRSPASLRRVLLTGLLLLQTALLVGIALTVHTQARDVAYAGTRAQLATRAKTLAAIVELDQGRVEFELSRGSVPEYYEEESGVYAIVYPAQSEPLRSPSIGSHRLPATVPWERDRLVHEERAAGPFGHPCAIVTLSFLARGEIPDADDPPEEAALVPSDAESRFQVRVALDTRERAASLAGLAWFLAVVSGGALALTAAGGWWLAQRVLQPIQAMTEEATQLSADDTDRRLAPFGVVKELRVLAETLNGAFQRLADALVGQRRFTADASHELRTPISVLLSNSDLLLRRKRTVNEYVEGLELQRKVALRMRGIVENLLALARSDADRRTPAMEPAQVQALATQVAEESDGIARCAGITLEVDLEPGLVLSCDRDATLRLLANLVSNALKFTPAGGRVGLSAVGEGRDVVLTVWDTGPGIPESERACIFDRFYRIRGATSGTPGAGLGLALVQEVVEAHGGSVVVDEHVSGGAQFVVRIPGRIRVQDTVARRSRLPGLGQSR